MQVPGKGLLACQTSGGFSFVFTGGHTDIHGFRDRGARQWLRFLLLPGVPSALPKAQPLASAIAARRQDKITANRSGSRRHELSISTETLNLFDRRVPANPRLVSALIHSVFRPDLLFFQPIISENAKRGHCRDVVEYQCSVRLVFKSEILVEGVQALR